MDLRKKWITPLFVHKNTKRKTCRFYDIDRFKSGV